MIRQPRWQPPDLALQIEIIRRRADADAPGIRLRCRPHVATERVAADGEVAVQADPHTAGARRGTYLRELLAQQPLQVFVKLDLDPVCMRKFRDRRGIRIPELSRPIRITEFLVQYFKHGVAAQCGSLRALKIPEQCRARRVACQMPGAKLRVDRVEHRALQFRHGNVVDEFRVAQALQFELEIRRRDHCYGFGAGAEVRHGFDLEVQRIREATGGRTVRAHPLRCIEVQRMQRVDRDQIGAELAEQHCRAGEVAEIADPPVARRAHAVHLQCKSPRASARRLRGRRRMTGFRGDDEAGPGTAVRARKRRFVVAERQRERQAKIAPAAVLSGDRCLFEQCQRRRDQLAGGFVPGFRAHAPRDGIVPGVHGINERHARRGMFAEHAHGRREPQPVRLVPRAQCRFHRLFVAAVDAHRGQQAARGVFAERMPRAPDIVIPGLYAAGLCQPGEQRVGVHRRGYRT